MKWFVLSLRYDLSENQKSICFTPPENDQILEHLLLFSIHK